MRELDFHGFFEAFKQDQLQGAYLCLVEEPYLWDWMRKTLEQSLSMPAMNFVRVPFASLTPESAGNFLCTVPMLDTHRIILFEGVPLKREQMKANEKLWQAILSLLEKAGPETLVFFGFSGAKPFSGTIYKKLIAHANLIRFSRLSVVDLRRFIEKKLRAKDLQFDAAVVQEIIQSSRYLEKDSEATLFDVQVRIDQAIGVQVQGVLHAAAVHRLLFETHTQGVFDFLDAFSRRDRKAALEKLTLHLKEEDAYGLFYMVVRQIRNLLAVKLSLKRGVSAAQLRTKMGLSSYEYGKLQDFSKRFREEELFRAHADCFSIEYKMKSTSTDLELELFAFVAKLCR